MIYVVLFTVWVFQEMTLKGGTSQACAACKYQRRKCTPECALAPYFPPDQPKMFQNAHKLFGVSNILKIIKHLDPSQKMEAMRSIIYQSNIRDRFPVYGCWGIIAQLDHQIRQAEEELHAVNVQLSLYRQHEISSNPNDHSTSQLQLGMALPSNNGLNLSHQDNNPQQHYNSVATLPIGMHQAYSNRNGGYNCYTESKDNIANSMWVQQPYSNESDDNEKSMATQSQLISSQPAIQEEVTHDYDEIQYDEIHPFFDTIDDRQSYIDSKDAYESSSESSLKDTTQSLKHVAKDKLKSAAACFSLTSVN
ncbi:hypothetical protein LguiA_009555 [Lonicera macranthoides]